MRDKRKDKQYFDRYLDYQYSRIEKKRAKLKETSDEEKRQRILVSLVHYDADLLKAEFSAGANKDRMIELLNAACQDSREYAENTKDTILVLMSLSIMLNSMQGVRAVIDNAGNTIKKDRLLFCLAAYIVKRQVEWNRSIDLSWEYAGLDRLFETEDIVQQTDFLKKYLNSWYENHADYSWYDSHKADTDTYCGYWSFESAALVRVLELDDKDFQNMTYYPGFSLKSLYECKGKTDMGDDFFMQRR